MSRFLRLNKLVGPIVNKQNYGWPVSAAIPSHCQIKNHFSFAIAHLTSKGAVQPPFFFTSRLARDSARSRGSTLRGYTGLLKYITVISIL